MRCRPVASLLYLGRMHKMARSGCKKPMISSKPHLSFLLVYLVTQLLSVTPITEANSISNPLPFHFSRFPRHETSTSSKDQVPETLHKKPKQDFESLVKTSMSKAEFARALALNVSLSYRSQVLQRDPALDCLELLDDTIDILSNIMNPNDNKSDSKSDEVRPKDVHTWLSAAVTNQDTCMQSLGEGYNSSYERGAMDLVSKKLRKLLLASLSTYVSTRPERISSSTTDTADSFPDWVSRSGRKLLEAPVNELRVQAVVAADGTGTHKSIGEALKILLSDKKKKKGDSDSTVIYLKAGTYHETINIPTKQKNVVLIGDGKGKTVITGYKNVKDGSTTFHSATVAVMGDGFIMRDITIVNSAGPGKGQAVALRLGSDKSVVYRCSIQGYQDSLYAHSKRQFYGDSDIYGTIDFIFGNAAAVFQSSKIFVRSEQGGYITAQGRSDPDHNTGFSIHNCRITSESNAKVYLGRPWRLYARVVYMQSYMDKSIDPSGWAPWSGNFDPETLYYGEYKNSGPGSSVSGRVKWPGYHASLSSEEAEKFTVADLISGNQWLPPTRVSYTSGLYK